ncbi:MAG: MoxR family ATPase [Candidatus Altiarchaeota archaeon]|nr:MoxR family ATPase [Candidatus Altiarchaeota archaeon]
MMDELRRKVDCLRTQVTSSVLGYEMVVDEVLICLFSCGHMLLEGPPGVGKTHLAKTIAALIDASFGRISATPDLKAQDIFGDVFFDSPSKTQYFRKGPIFANIVLIDEVNRAPHRIQSAFLEAMGESAVSITGETHTLPRPFFLIATQNPIEYVGTYKLPEAQRDRFMMKTKLTYMRRADEKKLLNSKINIEPLTPALSCPELLSIQKKIREEVSIPAEVIEQILDILQATRTRKEVVIGASTRAGISYVNAVKSRAFLEGRCKACEEDVFELAHPILRHRIAMNQDSTAFGFTEDDLLNDILRRFK